MAYENHERTLPWSEGGVDWGEPCCWACGYYAETWPMGSLKAWNTATSLHRCHVIPHALGGSDEPLNLVLMCSRCHEESPDHANPNFLFEWMRNHPKRVMGKWTADQIRDLGAIVETALNQMTEQELATEARAAIEGFYAGVSTHFGSISDGTRNAALDHLSRQLTRSSTTVDDSGGTA